MRRRSFLGALGAGAPGLAAGAGSSPSRDTESREPKVFFYDDGRHASPLYQFSPPLSPDDLTHTVDQLVSSGVDTLIYSAGLEGGVVQYDSEVGQKWGDNVDVWIHPIFYRAARNLRQLIADGHDPLQLLCDRSHQKGLWFLPTLPVAIIGGPRAKDNGYGRKSDFAYDNPQYYVGDDNHPLARQLGRMFGLNRLSLLHAAVRRERFELFEELLTRYETDGVEVDLSLDNEFGPHCRFDEVPQLAPVLTEWLRDLRVVADKAQQSQGRRKRIYARIPAGGADVWNMVGFEVRTWVSEGLVDGFVSITAAKKETPRNRRILLDQHLELQPAVELTQGKDCRVLMGLRGTLGRQLESSATPPMIWAAAALAYEQGADGFGLCDGMWAPNGWPWTHDDYATLRLLGHPDLLATADKHYVARSLARGSDSTEGLFPVAGPILPQALKEGRPVSVPLTITDELDRRAEEGRLEQVRLSVRLTNIELPLDQVEVRLNGKPLPDDLLEPSDLHFRAFEKIIVGPYGYVIVYLLPRDRYPVRGENSVQVTLVRRDPKITVPVDLYDVDLSIKYRNHRHFQDQPIHY